MRLTRGLPESAARRRACAHDPIQATFPLDVQQLAEAAKAAKAAKGGAMPHV